MNDDADRYPYGKGDPLSAILLAVLANKQPGKTLVVSKREFESVPKGMELKFWSTGDECFCKLVPKRRDS
jgi:hypothetical protein